MAFSLCILASGSSGNCAILRTPAGVIMIDAGLSPRATAKRLEGTGVAIQDIRAICLTHLDSDHYQPGWDRLIVHNRIRVFCSLTQRRRLVRYEGHRLDPFVCGVDDMHFEPLSGTLAQAIHLRHDEYGSSGYLISVNGARLGYATDLGRVPPALIEAFCGVDVLAIESNYDPHLQQASNRPAFLKSRIMDGWGHLSNQQAFDAADRIFSLCSQRHGRLPSHLVLLHRSRECNCPDLLRSLFTRDARFADRLTLAEQALRTEWIEPVQRPPVIGEQLSIGFDLAPMLQSHAAG